MKGGPVGDRDPRRGARQAAQDASMKGGPVGDRDDPAGTLPAIQIEPQ